MIDHEKVSTLMYKALNESKLTVTDLATVAEVPVIITQMILNGRLEKVTLIHGVRVCSILNVDVRDLIMPRKNKTLMEVIDGSGKGI
jgi:DNA-binding Xre family transcriptional regulator